MAAVVAPSTPVAALTTATQVSAGGLTSCAVMTGGNAYCWGDNTYGQFGDGTTTSSKAAVLVSGGYTWQSISTSNNGSGATTCGVTTTNAGYCWGGNGEGTVGDGTTTQRTIPTAISGGHAWSTISVGYEDTCGVTTTGVGYCWGANGSGEVGNGTTTQSNSPSLVSGGYTWASINEGSDTTCGVTTTGVGYCWGYNYYGEVGDNNAGFYPHVPDSVVGGHTWSSIYPGWEDTCGVTTSGVGYCWGRNSQGADGNNTTTENDSPVLVSGGYTWSEITEGFGSTCGMTTAGAAYCWGVNWNGQLGDGTSTERDVPTATLGGITFSSVFTGSTYSIGSTTCGVARDGIVYCWGRNTNGQIGDGTTGDGYQPTEAALLFASTSNTTASVTIASTFTFSVGNQSSACNGESNFVSGAGGASTVALGNLAAGANVSGGQALTVTGNTGGGFVVYVAGTQAANNLRSGSHNWTDVAGSYASPTVLGAGERFGYTYKDSTTSSSVTNPSSANFVALTNTNEAIMGTSGSSSGGSGCVSYDAQTSAATPAASYTATVIYTAVPTY